MWIYPLLNPYVQQHAGVEELLGTCLLNNLCEEYNSKITPKIYTGQLQGSQHPPS